MKLFGLEISRIKAQALVAVDSMRGWFSVIKESFGGAWQRNITVDGPRELLAFSAVFACVTQTASDFSKLRVKLVEEDGDGICTEIKNSPFLAVLKKPNRYQTRIKFFEQWIVSKLLYGNTYVLKQRDGRGMVRALYILDAQRVKALVTEDGGVYYELAKDYLSDLPEPIKVPASEIIHDMMVSLWHPLVGVSPIFACAMSATQGNRIQANSATFFQNMSRPSGQLTSPTTIPAETAQRLKEEFEKNFSGGNIGRLMVAGDGLKYEPMTIPPEQAQLIEQLKWTVEDVARCFHMPLFKIGGPVPVGSSVEVLQQTYYNDCLHPLFEAAELCLDEGLGLPAEYYTEFDLDGLLRMDTAAMIKAEAEAVGAGIKAPDESRKRLNLRKVPGGASPYLQQQNYSLAALAKRDASNDPFGTSKPAAVAPTGGGPAANDTQAADNAAAAKSIADSLCGIADLRSRMESDERASRERVLETEKAMAARHEAARLTREAELLAEKESAQQLADLFINGLAEHAVA